MRYTLFAIVMLVSMVAAACAEPSVSATLTVQLVEATPQNVDRTVEVLTRRFTEILPAWKSSVTASVIDRTITFTFRGAAPAEDELHYLTFTRGELLVGPADDPRHSWVSDRDVRDAAVTHIGDDPFLNVRLNPDASRRLAEETAKNVGRTLLVTWDGQEILTAPILGPFGEEFVFNAPSISEGQLMRVVLKAGRLPTTVDNADFKHGV